jgi:hypothetical protein
MKIGNERSCKQHSPSVLFWDVPGIRPLVRLDDIGVANQSRMPPPATGCNENCPSFSSAIVSAPNECLCSTFLLAVLAVGLVTVQQRVNASSTTVDGATVEKLTGGHTRVVWLTDLENKDTFKRRNQLQLVGYDSRDGKGERIIWVTAPTIIGH